MSKTTAKAPKAKAVTAPPPVIATTPIEPPKRKRRRRRRSPSLMLAQRTLLDIKRKERAFLADVSRILSEALGFPVRVSHVKLRQPMTPAMSRFARLPKAAARRQIMEAFAPLDDALPI